MMPFMTAPFGNFCKKSEVTTDIQIDAVYILALAYRDKPVCDLELLLSYSKEVVFLFSDEITNWGYSPSQRIRFESMSNYTDYANEYLSRNGNLNPSITHRPNFDIPLKRSFALYDARSRKYQKILLLDDDIYTTANSLESGIAALFKGMTIVGFHVVDYPDVSTIDHICRIALNCENTLSMTGSCMFINVDLVHGDFPNVYNEDLFFFMQQYDPDTVVSGGYIFQREYEPWLSLERIKHEQFGDLIYDALKKRFLGLDASLVNWDAEIEERKKQIGTLLEIVSRKEIIVALEAALDGLTSFDTKDIVAFLDAINFPEWITKYL